MRMMRALCCVILALLSMAMKKGGAEDGVVAELSRDDFPRSFVFGAGTSAYQVEGAAAEDGRTPSIWDTAAHAGDVSGKETGDIAADEYHKYKEDVMLMKETGLEAYRFSISWSRLIPNGRGDINLKGLQYYNHLIDELISSGIEPHATLYHYDLPQALEDEYGGWLNQKVVYDFTVFANVCFREFGDRVSHWTTLNEPNAIALGGYDVGIFPPNRCSYISGYNCSKGDSSIEPYIVMHHFLLAHSSVASLYKKNYKDKQKGLIGINIFMYNFVSLTQLKNDENAAKRAQEFYIGWIVDSLLYGDYPDTMKKFTGTKIPEFTKEQSQQLIGSFDFIGLNYYATLYVKDNQSNAPPEQRDFSADLSAKLSSKIYSSLDEKISTFAHGLQGVLEYLKQVYDNPPIYIQENGYAMINDRSTNDTARVKFLSAHLESLLGSLRNGSNVMGYFMWSFVDTFELLDGYNSSYGLYYVDFEDKNLRRYPRHSACWYANFLKKQGPDSKLVFAM